MLQKWKEKSGEFSKKCQTNTEKTYEKYGKISDVFWKNSNVFQEISYVFSGTSEILSQSEKSDFGKREVWRLWKQKVQNPREGARVARAWGKTSMKGGKMEQKRPAISSHIARALPS